MSAIFRAPAKTVSLKPQFVTTVFKPAGLTCPKCDGSMLLDKDVELNTWFIKCLQCGFQRDLRQSPKPARRVQGSGYIKGVI